MSTQIFRVSLSRWADREETDTRRDGERKINLKAVRRNLKIIYGIYGRRLIKMDHKEAPWKQSQNIPLWWAAVQAPNSSPSVISGSVIICRQSDLFCRKPKVFLYFRPVIDTFTSVSEYFHLWPPLLALIQNSQWAEAVQGRDHSWNLKSDRCRGQQPHVAGGEKAPAEMNVLLYMFQSRFQIPCRAFFFFPALQAFLFLL